MTANDNRPPDRGPGLALFWAVSAIRKPDAVQDCIDSGRHDCVGLDDGSR